MGLGCSGDGGSTCQPLSELGESCSDRLCKLGLRCAAGTCAALLALGGSCSIWQDCSSMRCVAGVCASPFVGLGESCVESRKADLFAFGSIEASERSDVYGKWRLPVPGFERIR